MKSDRTSERRENTLRAAIALFSRTHDVNKVSLEAIAEKAGVSPATIYNYFGTREKLVSEIAKKLVQELLENSRALISSDLPFPEKVRQLFSVKRDLLEHNNAILRKLISQDKSILNEDLNLAEIRSLSTEFFEAGKRQGYVDPSISDQTLAEYFDIIRLGIAAKPELAARLSENTSLADEFSRLILYGTLKKDVDIFGKKPSPGIRSNQ
jgi:TetR/AcrR family transcriptional regulator, cholesterol catabolism regulator